MITIKHILQNLNVIEFKGNENGCINDVIQLNTDNQREDVLFWCSDKNAEKLNACSQGTVICSVKTFQSINVNNNCNYIVVENPRLTFSKLLSSYFVPKQHDPIVSKNAVIHPSVKIGHNVFIGDFTVIEQGCCIGNNCYIGYNNTIYQNTSIKDNVKIGSNNTIGGVGFGYEKDEDGAYQVIPHIGNVLIEDNVEIGNNTCVDRAVMGNTVLGKNCKIDNLVHIAHGVIIGENSLIIAHAMVGGSTTIGKNVWVAPNSSLINKINIGDNATIGLGAVVVKNVNTNDVVVGNPAKPLYKK